MEEQNLEALGGEKNSLEACGSIYCFHVSLADTDPETSASLEKLSVQLSVTS